MPIRKISYLSLFPEVIEQGLRHSLVGRARNEQKIELNFIQLRHFAEGKHASVDDIVYGGGAGMLLKVDVLYRAWHSLSKVRDKSAPLESRPYTLLLSPQGKRFTQERAKDLARNHVDIILVCGHYEGVDERFIDTCVDEEISIGDYVLTGGEFAALIVSDAVIRLIPGVVGNAESITGDSLENGFLKAPQYTRPREFLGQTVPEVLLSGNHAHIEKWRKDQSTERTARKRPDLLLAKNKKADSL